MNRLFRAECDARSSKTRRIWAASGTYDSRCRMKDALAFVDVGVGEREAILGELKIAALHLGEPQQLQGFGHREEFVDLHLQVRGDFRQIGGAVEGRRRHGLHESRQQVGGHLGKDAADP